MTGLRGSLFKGDWGERHLAVFGVLVASYLALSPVVKGAVTTGFGLLVVFAAIFGRGGFRTLGPEAKWIYTGFVAYVVSAIISLMNNGNWDTAVWRFEKYHPFLFMGFVFSILALLPRRLIERALLAGVLFGSVFMALFAFYSQEVLDIQRVGEGSGFDKNIFGHLAFIYALLALAAVSVLQRGRWIRAGLLVAAALACYAGFATGSRGALLAFFAGLAVVAAFYLADSEKRTRTYWYSIASGILFLVGVGLLLASSDFWRQHVSRITVELSQYHSGEKKETSIGYRLAMWESAVEVWTRHPLIGTGIGDGQNELESMVAEGQISPKAVFFHYHNIYFETLATTGILGLLTMLIAIFIIPFLYFRRVLAGAENETERFVAVAGFAILVLQMVFGTTNGWLYLRGLLNNLLIMALLMAMSSRFRVEADD